MLGVLCKHPRNNLNIKEDYEGYSPSYIGDLCIDGGDIQSGYRSNPLCILDDGRVYREDTGWHCEHIDWFWSLRKKQSSVPEHVQQTEQCCLFERQGASSKSELPPASPGALPRVAKIAASQLASQVLISYHAIGKFQIGKKTVPVRKKLYLLFKLINKR